jgi:hypothetical protein
MVESILERTNEPISTPRSVSMNRGGSAESPSAARSRRTAVFSPCSKSTKVPPGHSRDLSSSRPTTSPGRPNNARRICVDSSGTRTLAPRFRSSPERASSSNGPNRNFWSELAGPSMSVGIMDRRVAPRDRGLESVGMNWTGEPVSADEARCRDRAVPQWGETEKDGKKTNRSGTNG